MKQIDHRTRVTQFLIRKAFTGLLQEKPIQNISVKELCERADINRGTFYSHYTDIYDLRDKMEESMTEDFIAALQPLLDGPDLTPLAFTTGIFQCIKDNSDLCTVTLGPYGDKDFAGKLVDIGRRLCVQSYSRYFEHASPEKIEYYYAFVSAGCIGILEKWMAEGMTTDAAVVAKIAGGIMKNGIGFLQEK